MNYDNKVALITGGSSGIGLAVARKLSAAGARVWLLARRKEQLEAALAEVESHRRSPEQLCGVISADVTDFDQAASAVAQVTERAGVPDLVVNSAGVTHPGYFQDLDLDIFRWMMDVNYFGTVHITKAVLPGMLERGSGYVVNISSMAGVLGAFGYTAYGASKYAVRGFTDALRAEVKPLGIDVSIVFPPDTDTPQLHYENQFKPMEVKIMNSTAGMLSPDEVADTVLRGMARRRYVIVPGMEARVLYWLAGHIGNGVYPIMDWLVARAQRQVRREKGHS